jgi:hypothetical protein
VILSQGVDSLTSLGESNVCRVAEALKDFSLTERAQLIIEAMEQLRDKLFSLAESNLIRV